VDWFCGTGRNGCGGAARLASPARARRRGHGRCGGAGIRLGAVCHVARLPAGSRAVRRRVRDGCGPQRRAASGRTPRHPRGTAPRRRQPGARPQHSRPASRHRWGRCRRPRHAASACPAPAAAAAGLSGWVGPAAGCLLCGIGRVRICDRRGGASRPSHAERPGSERPGAKGHDLPADHGGAPRRRRRDRRHVADRHGRCDPAGRPDGVPRLGVGPPARRGWAAHRHRHGTGHGDGPFRPCALGAGVAALAVQATRRDGRAGSGGGLPRADRHARADPAQLRDGRVGHPRHHPGPPRPVVQGTGPCRGRADARDALGSGERQLPDELLRRARADCGLRSHAAAARPAARRRRSLAGVGASCGRLL